MGVHSIGSSISYEIKDPEGISILNTVLKRAYTYNIQTEVTNIILFLILDYIFNCYP